MAAWFLKNDMCVPIRVARRTWRRYHRPRRKNRWPALCRETEHLDLRQCSIAW